MQKVSYIPLENILADDPCVDRGLTQIGLLMEL